MKREKFIIQVIRSMRLTLLVIYGFFSSPLIMESQAMPLQEVSATNVSSTTTTTTAAPINEEIAPFLVVSDGYTLYSLPYTWPEPPTKDDRKEIYRYIGSNTFHSISAISYHFRLKLLFWSATDGRVYTASFKDRTKLTNVTFEEVLTGFPWEQLVVADLAVDWISDKLYFTVRDAGRIEERDLKTGEKRVVLQSGEPAAFNGLVVFPYPDRGWLFWTDNQGGNIERVAVGGDGRVVIRGGLESCIWPLEIDYQKQAVYWVNTCEHTLRSLQVNDTLQSADTVPITTSFDGTSSMTLFDNVLYWNEGGTIKGINKSINMGDIVEIYRGTSSSLIESAAVELIHPKKQPQVDEFIRNLPENKTCPSCVNGRCITLGLCICDEGWSGDNCTTDIDECEQEEDDCEYKCHNAPGSFYCSCNSTSYLDSDGRTCILASLTTTYVVSPTVSSYGPEETSTGDHASTSTTFTNVGPIHSRTIMASDTPLHVSSSQIIVVLPSSPAAASSTSTSDIVIHRTSQYSFLPESSTTSLISEPTFLPTSKTDSSLQPKSTTDHFFLPVSTSAKSEPSLLSTATISLVNLYSRSSIGGIVASPAVTSRLLATPTKPTTISFITHELHKPTSTYDAMTQAAISTSATTTTTLLGLTSSLSTAITSTASLVVTPSPTFLPTTSLVSTTSVLSVVSSSPALPTPYATRAPFTPSSMVSGPVETPTTASATTQSITDSSTDSSPMSTEPAADGMTLIIIAAAAAGACVILIIVVVIVIAAVVRYVSKRCGSYTVNPDPVKSSSVTPSWITVHSSPSAAPNQANGLHSNGHSVRTKSFRDTSPTCSSNSFS